MSRTKTPELLNLIEASPNLARSFAQNKDDLKKILLQMKFDLVDEKNQDDVGKSIFAFKEIETAFDNIILCGEAIIQKENKKKKETE